MSHGNNKRLISFGLAHLKTRRVFNPVESNLFSYQNENFHTCCYIFYSNVPRRAL